MVSRHESGIPYDNCAGAGDPISHPLYLPWDDDNACLV